MGGRGGRYSSVVLIAGNGETGFEDETKPMGPESRDEEEPLGEVGAVGESLSSSTELPGSSENASVDVGLVMGPGTSRAGSEMGEVTSVLEPVSTESGRALNFSISAVKSFTVKVDRCSSRQVDALLVGDSPSISEGFELSLFDLETTSATMIGLQDNGLNL